VRGRRRDEEERDEEEQSIRKRKGTVSTKVKSKGNNEAFTKKQLKWKNNRDKRYIKKMGMRFSLKKDYPVKKNIKLIKLWNF